MRRSTNLNNAGNNVVEMLNVTRDGTHQDVFAITGNLHFLVAVNICATEKRQNATKLEESVFVNMEEDILIVDDVENVALMQSAKR